jgi:hypothetical protein
MLWTAALAGYIFFGMSHEIRSQSLARRILHAISSPALAPPVYCVQHNESKTNIASKNDWTPSLRTIKPPKSRKSPDPPIRRRVFREKPLP